MDFVVGTGCLFALADVSLKLSLPSAALGSFRLLRKSVNRLRNSGKVSFFKLHHNLLTHWQHKINGFTFLHIAPLVTVYLRAGGAGW